MLQLITQRSDKQRIWFDLAVVENPDTSLTFPAGSFWLHGTEYALPAYTTPIVGTAPFRIFIEKTPTGADYFFDTTFYGKPATFGDQPGAVIGAFKVVWRDDDGQPITVLRSVPHA